MKLKITVDVETEDIAVTDEICVDESDEETGYSGESQGTELVPDEPDSAQSEEEDAEVAMVTTRRMNLQAMKNFVRDKQLEVGDQLIIHFDGKPACWDVIGINAELSLEDEEMEGRTCVTVQSHDLLEERQFDKDGRNIWRESSLREYLNSREFQSRLDDDFVQSLTKVYIENGAKDSVIDTTIDTFFLLSKEEYDPEKTKYPYYRNPRNRVKFAPDDTTDWHWLRSALRNSANLAWIVNSAGNVYYTGAFHAGRCAPACVLIF